GVAVRVEVGAREGGGEERHAELVRAGVQLVHVAVLGLAQLGLADDGAEVGGKVVAGMRRVENQRRHRGSILQWKRWKSTTPGAQPSTRRSSTSRSDKRTSRACGSIFPAFS